MKTWFSNNIDWFLLFFSVMFLVGIFYLSQELMHPVQTVDFILALGCMIVGATGTLLVIKKY